MFQQFDDALGMIFAFPRIGIPSKDNFSPNLDNVVYPDFLEAVVELLTSREIEIISLREARSRIVKPRANQRFAVLTFDGAFRKTAHHVAPMMRSLKQPYTIYVATGLVEGSADLWREGLETLVRQQSRLLVQTLKGPFELDCTNMAAKQRSFEFLQDYLTTEVPELGRHDRLREICWLYKIDLDEIRDKAIMGWDEIAELESDELCTIGAMTIDNHRVSQLDDTKARYEILQGASVLEGVLGERVRHMCYPHGDQKSAGLREFELARKARFLTAVTRRPGLIYPEHRDHLMALPRIPVSGLLQRHRYVSPLTSGLPTRVYNGFRKLNVGD